ncbi:MAG: dimethylsulfonioproprionate lyase family protein [Pseudomonadota bacterium]
MNPETAYRNLIIETEGVLRGHPDMAAFAPFPADVRPQDLQPTYRNVCDMMCRDTGLVSHRYPDLVHAVLAAAPHMLWRGTYDDSAPFMERWGCFTVLGEGGPFVASRLRVFVVYMPPGLYYPSHRHPAEEIYLVIAGNGRFYRAGLPDQHLGEGDTAFHASEQVHAIETQQSPMLSVVAWRSHLTTPPVLVPEADGLR